MDEDFTGLWWRADASDQRVAGHLSVGEDRMPVLELEGSLEMTARVDYPRYPVIYGTAGGTELTLRGAQQISLNMLSQAHQELAIEEIFVGGQLPADAAIDEVIVEIDGLADWVALSALHSEEQHKADGSLSGVSITFNPPTDLAITLSDGCQLSIEFQPISKF